MREGLEVTNYRQNIDYSYWPADHILKVRLALVHINKCRRLPMRLSSAGSLMCAPSQKRLLPEGSDVPSSFECVGPHRTPEHPGRAAAVQTRHRAGHPRQKPAHPHRRKQGESGPRWVAFMMCLA